MLGLYDDAALLKDEFSGAHGAVMPALGLRVQRKETETPLALKVHSLDHPSTVRTRSWCWLP